MIGIALRLLSPIDRFSQRAYMRLTVAVLSRAGVEIEGMPLWVSPSVYWDRSGGITLGNRCVISHGVRLLTHDFSLDRVAERYRGQSDKELSRRAPIRVGAYAFIGMGVIVLPGVEIGDGAIVGSGAVVTKDVRPDSIVAGNPAREIGDTESLLARRETDFSWAPRRK